MRILIAVPTFETIQPEVFKAIYGLESDHELYFDFVKGYDCAIARNKIAELALEGGFDYVLMIDSDTIVPDKTLKWMLEEPTDICLGVCPRKNTKDGRTAILKWGSSGWDDDYYYSDLPESRVRVKAGGFACALIRTQLFNFMPHPWFQYGTNENGGTFSEDFYFCRNANAFGHRIELEPRVRCGHLARYFQYQ